MNKVNTFKIIDTYGKETEYEILTAFKWNKTNKNYIVYTDNTYDENSNLNIFASIYYPNDDSTLDDVLTEEEWREIEKNIKLLTFLGSDLNEL